MASSSSAGVTPNRDVILEIPELSVDSIGLTVQDVRAHVGDKVYERIAIEKPAECPERWKGLIGEYGPDDQVVFVLEKDGKLHLLIEWFFLYPLEEEVADRFRLP